MKALVNYELCAGNAGAELDMTDCDAKTGLHLACSEGHYDVVVQLLRAGANVNLVNLQVNTRARHVRGVGRCNSRGKDFQIFFLKNLILFFIVTD